MFMPDAEYARTHRHHSLDPLSPFFYFRARSASDIYRRVFFPQRHNPQHAHQNTAAETRQNNTVNGCHRIAATSLRQAHA
jgi:hypothetical protein